MRYWIMIAAVAFLGQNCTSEKIPDEIQSAIHGVKQEYAPDKRVALFDIQPEKEQGIIVLKGETNLPEALEELLDRLAEAGYEAEDQVTLLPSQELEGKQYGIVRLSVSNIRSKPGHSQELSTQATLGTALRVYKKQDNWYLVQTPDHYLGWLDAGGFERMDSTAFERWQASERVVYLPDFGFSLEAPESGSSPVSDLLRGNILEKKGEEGEFVRVGYPDGRTAYVLGSEVIGYDDWLASREPNVENIIKEAFRFMGRPYLWGGTSGKGVDCSGFTKTVFFNNGLLLPRDASQQVHTGEEVATDTTLAGLQPGDLLFFGRKATADTKEKITHVAIYLGEGRIIHSSGIVKVESLRRGDPDFAEDRLNTFVRAKRLLDETGKNGVERLAESVYY